MLKGMSENETLQNRNWNVLIYMTGVVVLFFILLMRLFSLQFTHYDENLQRSENNRIRKVVLVAERGYIYDRNGEVLVRNRPSYQIALSSINMPRKKSEIPIRSSRSVVSLAALTPNLPCTCPITCRPARTLTRLFLKP